MDITVIGGTGYAGAAITAEAAGRAHRVTSLSRSLPDAPVEGVDYVQGDATDAATLERVVDGADAVVSAIAPRGPLAEPFRAVTRSIAGIADTEGARLYVVGGFSSLRPAPGAPRFVEDLSHVPPEVHEEVLNGAALILEDLPATPDTLHWVFVSPAKTFGSFAPQPRLGRYRIGDDEISVDPDGSISDADYALGFVDVMERDDLRRAHVNLTH